MTPVDLEIARLRWRAERLVEVARLVESVWLEGIVLRAGDDTWIGPTADAFRGDLWRLRVERDAASRSLRDLAIRLEAQATAMREEQLRAGLRS